MPKPVMKRKIGITCELQITKSVFFDASQEDAEKFKDFGALEKRDRENHWHLKVDARYDFQDILDYIEEINSEN